MHYIQEHSSGLSLDYNEVQSHLPKFICRVSFHGVGHQKFTVYDFDRLSMSTDPIVTKLDWPRTLIISRVKDILQSVNAI